MKIYRTPLSTIISERNDSDNCIYVYTRAGVLYSTLPLHDYYGIISECSGYNMLYVLQKVLRTEALLTVH